VRVVEAVRFGGPEVLVPMTVADPVPGPGEAVVAVAAADVLSLDVMIRSGAAAAFFPVRPPYVPGNGVAGEVADVGAGVDRAWVGRRVVAHTGAHGGSGGYAQRAVVPVEALVPVPAGLDAPRAAALLHDGATALGLLDGIGIRPKERVLVTAAAGGMGLLLVQLASAAGAQVVAAARGRRKLDLAVGHGAHAAVDYAEPDWPRRVVAAMGGAAPDVVFDGAGGGIGLDAFGIVADGGRFSAHGAPSGGFAPIDQDDARRRGVTVRGIDRVQFPPAERAALVARALDEGATGRLSPVIGQTFPLERAADAHAAIAARAAVGKTLLLTR
jgi:NADPH2:quinone reductase